jgi:peroxiredoxin
MYVLLVGDTKNVLFKGGVMMRRLTMIFFFMLVFLLCSISIAADQFFEAGVQKLETPIAAPDFTLKDLKGRKISLKDLRGKVVVLNFFSIWCSACERQASSFDKLDEEIKGKDIVFFHVAVEGREKELLEYKNKFNISVPILIDKSGSIAKAYRIRGHHETFFIDRKGKIVGKTFAEADWISPAMKNLIQYLLSQK